MWYTTPLGYLVWFDPYQGKVDSSRTQENNLGLAGNLVINFVDVLASFGRKFFHLCYDNFFNSLKLVTTLEAKFVKAQEQFVKIEPKNALKKQGRGNYDFKTDTNHGVIVCKWNDNSVVNLCSNAAVVHPFLTLLGIHPLKRSVCKLNSHTWSSSITKIWEALTEWTRIFQTIEFQCEVKSGIFVWFPICLIFPSTMHGDCKKLVMKIRWIYYTFEDILPGHTCLSMPSHLIKDCEGVVMYMACSVHKGHVTAL